MQECKQMKAAGAEMDRLTDAYHRYQDLRDERNRRERRIKRLAAMLFPDELPDSAELGHMVSRMDSPPANSDLALWEILEEYLAVVGETPISDAADMLLRFSGERATRQGVESAAKRHPEVFKVRKREGVQIISLK